MVKLRDIAEATGLTVSTVSKALNHSAEISKSTTDMVWEKAREMGYVFKKPANPSHRTIGVIIPEVRSNYYAELLHSLANAIEKNGLTMITVMSTEYSASVKPYIERITQFKLDGLFVCGDVAFSDDSYQLLRESGIPTLLLTEVDLPYMMDSIYIKGETGIEMAVDHLLELGHTKIGYIGERASDMRYHAICKCLRQRGVAIVPAFMKRGEERFELGVYLCALELLKEKELPTAIFASYDQIAFGAIRAFQEQGIRVPEDISIVGFDNIVMDNYHPVKLSSITNPVDQMGITAVKILLDAIKHPRSHVVQNVALQSRLVLRKSTCPPADAAESI